MKRQYENIEQIKVSFDSAVSYQNCHHTEFMTVKIFIVRVLLFFCGWGWICLRDAGHGKMWNHMMGTINSRIHQEDERTSWNNISSVNLFRRIKMQYTMIACDESQWMHSLILSSIFLTVFRFSVQNFFIFIFHYQIGSHKMINYTMFAFCIVPKHLATITISSRWGIFTWLLFA